MGETPVVTDEQQAQRRGGSAPLPNEIAERIQEDNFIIRMVLVSTKLMVAVSATSRSPASCRFGRSGADDAAQAEHAAGDANRDAEVDGGDPARATGPPSSRNWR